MKARTTVLALLMLTVTSACSIFQPAVKGFVDGYCGQSVAERQTNRALIDAQTAPNFVRITCAQDAAENEDSQPAE